MDKRKTLSATNIVVLGIATLSALYGLTDIAIAGICISLAGFVIKDSYDSTRNS